MGSAELENGEMKIFVIRKAEPETLQGFKLSRADEKKREEAGMGKGNS